MKPHPAAFAPGPGYVGPLPALHPQAQPARTGEPAEAGPETAAPELLGWIPLGERLPEPGQLCAGYDASHHHRPPAVVAFDGEWWHYAGQALPPLTRACFTHWHPLPPLLSEAAATVTVRPDRRATLSRAVIRAVAALRASAPVDVVPPKRPGGPWFLDARPTATGRLPADPSAVARFTCSHHLPLSLFRRPPRATPGVFGGGTGKPETAAELAFTLGPEVENHPGYYALTPLP